METLVDRARLYLGKQETDGPNDGPNIRIWKGRLGPGVANAPNVLWCSVFVFNMLMERNGLNRKQLVAALGFTPGATYPESCDSFLSQLRAAHVRALNLPRSNEQVRLVSDPMPGDIGFMMAKNLDGTYSETDARHVYIVTGKPVGNVVPTVEGNTVPGTVEGNASRNGDGVYDRWRSIIPKPRNKFYRLPSSLTGHFIPLGGAS